MTQQEIIITSFGLQSVSKAIYAGAIDSLVVSSELAPGPNNNQYKGYMPNAPTPDMPDSTSDLGTPVWGNLVINPGQYFDTNLNQVISYGAYEINTILMTLVRVNNIVITKIQGRDGEVIEYIGKDSFRINFKGGFFGTGNARPVRDIQAFKNIINSNQPISVTAKILTDWDITEIVPLDLTLPTVAGGYNYQLFEFNAIQDTPIVLAQQATYNA